MKSVMITLRQLLCKWFDLTLDEDVNLLMDRHSYERAKDSTFAYEQSVVIVRLREDLGRASEANADLQLKLKQITFLENRVRELEIQLAKPKIEPKPTKAAMEPVIWSRSSWRAVAQQRSMATIPDVEPDSVKQLEKRVIKETNVPS